MVGVGTFREGRPLNILITATKCFLTYIQSRLRTILRSRHFYFEEYIKFFERQSRLKLYREIYLSAFIL